MLHTFVSLVEDTPGALTRVASLFRRLNINIISLTVGHSERNGVSRMTIVAEAPPGAGHRIKASMFKIENVLDVDDVGQLSCVVRELALIQVLNEGDNRILEISRTGRMVMRRGQHTSQVLEAMRVSSPEEEPIIPVTASTKTGNGLELVAGDPMHP